MPLATLGGLFIVLDDGAEAIMLRKSRLAAPDDVVTKTDLPGAIDAILANVQARISTWGRIEPPGRYERGGDPGVQAGRGSSV